MPLNSDNKLNISAEVLLRMTQKIDESDKAFRNVTDQVESLCKALDKVHSCILDLSNLLLEALESDPRVTILKGQLFPGGGGEGMADNGRAIPDELLPVDKVIEDKRWGFRFAIVQDDGCVQVKVGIKRGSPAETIEPDKIDSIINQYIPNDNHSFIKPPRNRLQAQCEEVTTNKGLSNSLCSILSKVFTILTDNQVVLLKEGYAIPYEFKDNLEKHGDEFNQIMTDFIEHKIGPKETAKRVANIAGCSFRDAERIIWILK